MHVIRLPTLEAIKMTDYENLGVYMALIGAVYVVILIGGYHLMHWRTKRMIRKYHRESGQPPAGRPPNCS